MVTLLDRARERARTLLDRNLVQRIWEKDPAVWGSGGRPGDPAVAASIQNRLGWLDASAAMHAALPELAALAETVRSEKVERAFLLGMGGSSLCAEVLRHVLGVQSGHPDLEVLDTTDARTVDNAARRMDAGRTVFVAASKSGTTLEVSSLERFFAERVAEAGLRSSVGSRFIAVTDPGTPLENLARREGYRAAFLNPPDIGGRFSALSLFGLVPATLIGADPSVLLEAGKTMAEGCRQENLTNPGLELGALMSVAAEAGRDKLTLLLPDGLSALGLWIEQLIAESTGKEGKGILPVVGEPVGGADDYGDDRVFVTISTEDERIDEGVLDRIGARHPLLRLSTRRSSLGAEFFRWEFAVAVAGAELGINPFDEPNVQEAKDRTRQLLDAYQRGQQPEGSPGTADETVAVYTPEPLRLSPTSAVRRFLDSGKAGDYVALLSYLSPEAAIDAALHDVRAAIRQRTRLATTSGVGPRYLHSTGQYHKGGPNTGVLILLTAEEADNVAIPGVPYSFGTLKRAQAVGDFQALAAHGRRVMRIHLTNPAADAAGILRNLFLG
jgi:glucose-6-phosphate isomerase